VPCHQKPFSGKTVSQALSRSGEPPEVKRPENFNPLSASSCDNLHGKGAAMLNQAAKIALLVLIPLSAFAMPKGRESITLQVVSSKTKIHSSSRNIFSYTAIMFTEVNGKKVVYECHQRGDVCPVMESGKTYTADREGDFIYISMSSPEDKKPFSVKYKQVGNW
jgi:hypothetical protein